MLLLATSSMALLCFAVCAVAITFFLSLVALFLFAVILGINIALFGCYNFFYCFFAPVERRSSLFGESSKGVKKVNTAAFEEARYSVSMLYELIKTGKWQRRNSAPVYTKDNIDVRNSSPKQEEKGMNASFAMVEDEEELNMPRKRHSSKKKDRVRVQSGQKGDEVGISAPCSSPSKPLFQNRQEVLHQQICREQIKETISVLEKSVIGTEKIVATGKELGYKSILKAISSYEKSSSSPNTSGKSDVETEENVSSRLSCKNRNEDKENIHYDCDLSGMEKYTMGSKQSNKGVAESKENNCTNIPLRQLSWDNLPKMRSPKKITFNERDTTFNI
eukprot:Nk52_evm54s223 gene=Nk52_evmTU54s223